MSELHTNGADNIQEYMDAAGDDAKRAYLDRVWSMDKIGMFKELMRVHGESAKLFAAAQSELDHLRMTLAQRDKSVQ